jgi:GcrA cell cycle regulator
MGMTPQLFWTAEKVAELRRSISDGEKTSEAAIHLGCTKNAVIGKCDRDGIRGPRSRGPLDRKAEPTPNPFGEHPGCLWPYDHPDNPNFHFCGAEKVPGLPYCATHAAIAYIRVSAPEAA